MFYWRVSDRVIYVGRHPGLICSESLVGYLPHPVDLSPRLMALVWNISVPAIMRDVSP
jgi:hypothetical protein